MIENVESDVSAAKNTTLLLTELDNLEDMLENLDEMATVCDNTTLSITELDEMQDLLNGADEEALEDKKCKSDKRSRRSTKYS
jgi:hypothetical protein